ncbi:component of SufBCD complex [Salipiger sp. P9]|uniref:component of SufBCD complex n=1 Tax=Salipiger pentaromativorans TaxID=2943193 RepID=UPI0021587F4E|nr:component of SufBCD complex [Salipiger pentaromativorans]MCR8547209.1 component of SufBCD complex [Salipiger pentaromativorans]
MDWYRIVLETIDMRSFSNLWFWIALAVTWSTASHWVLGVPFDMVARARRNGGQAAQDLEDLVRINTNRLLFIADETGVWAIALGSAVLSAMAVSGFVYGVELTQALFLLAFPMSLVALMSVATAARIQRNALSGAPLWKTLGRHRFWTQVTGMISIFITALWGMFQNMSFTALGG